MSKGELMKKYIKKIYEKKLLIMISNIQLICFIISDTYKKCNSVLK